MSPAEDAALLLAIARRHLRTLRIGLEAAYPEEDWASRPSRRRRSCSRSGLFWPTGDRRGRTT